jgi:hypothetical protein
VEEQQRQFLRLEWFCADNQLIKYLLTDFAPWQSAPLFAPNASGSVESLKGYNYKIINKSILYST